MVLPLEREGQMSTRTDICSGITFRKGRTNVNKDGYCSVPDLNLLILKQLVNLRYQQFHSSQFSVKCFKVRGH